MEVAINGNVDTGKAGTYTVTYNAENKAGNKAIATRTVKVNEAPDITPPVIKTIKDNYDLNETVSVQIEGHLSGHEDWIGIFPEGSDNRWSNVNFPHFHGH